MLAFAVAIGLLGVIAAYGVHQNQRAYASRRFVEDIHSTRELTRELESASAMMELHQRGFLVTGDPDALRQRDASYARGQERGRRLLALLAGDPLQQRRARDVLHSLDERYARMQRTGRIAEENGLEQARAGLLLRGAGSFGPVLAGLELMRNDHDQRLQQTLARANREMARFRRLLIYGTSASLLLLVAAAWWLMRQLVRNEALQAELVTTNAELAQKASELERNNRELDAFTYTISHDLRAPLRHIDGYARMLQEDAGDHLEPELRRYLDTISDSARRMGLLIDDLLAFARMGRKPLERTRIDMGELVQRALHEAGAGRYAGQVEVGELPKVEADPVLMRQAWVNLLSNAIKYSAPKGADARVHVTGERDGGWARYRVSDNGVGFDMRYADKLFGVFQRLHSQDEFEGTGVGLAIVQQILQRHGGRVSADASPGNGATFTLEFPVEETG